MVVFAIIRNFGNISLYGYGLFTRQLQLEYRLSSSDDFKLGSTDLICTYKKAGFHSLEYRAITTQPGYFENWWMTYDLICEDQAKIKEVVGFQFLGFIFGLPFIIMPDQIGRKKSMIVALAVSVPSVMWVSYSSDFWSKKWAYFLFGMFHMKITLAYTHIMEMTDNSNKIFANTGIAVFDSLTVAFGYVFLISVNSSVKLLVNMFNVMGIVGIVLFLIFIPESPRWLLLRDPNSKQGKDILNYIAKFNGSNKRVPDYAVMDNLDQVINDKEQADKQAAVANQINMTLNETIKVMAQGPVKSPSKFKMIMGDFK